MDVPSHIYDDAWSGGWRFYDKFLRFQTLYILGTYMYDVYEYIYIYIIFITITMQVEVEVQVEA